MSFFFFNDTATTEIYTLSLHDALPICRPALWPSQQAFRDPWRAAAGARHAWAVVSEDAAHACRAPAAARQGDRKSTRLNSSHSQISYAVFCLKKKKQKNKTSLHGNIRAKS